MYINTHSFYSLRYGTLEIDSLVQLAAEAGIKKFALTDINNTTGIFDFISACRDNGVEPVAGIEFRQDNDFQFLALAKNNEGFSEINSFLSYCHLHDQKIPSRAPEFRNVFVIYSSDRVSPSELLPHEFIGIQPWEVKKVMLRNSSYKNKFVIRHPVTFIDQPGYHLHLHLRAVDHNILLSRVNTVASAHPMELLFTEEQFRDFYKEFPEAIKNTLQLLDQCEIHFNYKESKNKKTFYGSYASDREQLHRLTYHGFNNRYGPLNKVAEERVRKELEIIEQMEYMGYYLITWDLVNESKNRGFYHVGRGSGANSIVAYCIGITDVDPIELDLYFERFLNPQRSSPPDFDIDYSWKDRDTMFQYLFERHTTQHVALLGTISTFKYNSMVRELGKVYGLPKSEIDRLAERRLDEPTDNKIYRKIKALSRKLNSFPNIRSVHAGGVLIGEKPISYHGAVDLPPKGLPTIQWDMYVAESINFEKLDVLSQRGIGHIKDCAEIIRINQGTEINVHEVEKFKNDKYVRAQLRKGDTIGCFYIESPAMRQLLKKLECEDYIHLVAASSIIRPGVASSGMMGQYIHRFHHPESFEYLHPVLKEQLGQTYGVMVYQEDVLKICHHYAGLDLSDADVLRRAMSGKYRNKDAFQELVKKFFDGAKALGRPEQITEEIWRQTSSFGGYSFCKAHSASFAVESFQSLFLKSYYPLEFMVAVINNFGGFYATWVYVKEAQKCGAKIQLPCINHSEYLTLIKGKEIYLGFTHIQQLQSDVAIDIVKQRAMDGPYTDLDNFIQRTKIGKEQLFILIKIGALRTLGPKKELFWKATLHLQKKVNTTAYAPVSLFEVRKKDFSLPVLQESLVEDAFDEIELLGFPVSMSEFQLLKTNKRIELGSGQLALSEGKKVRIMGNFVATKDVWTKNGKDMKFGTFLDEKLDFFDTVHFAKSMNTYPFTGRGVYLLEGKVVCDFGVPTLEVEKMAKLPYLSDPREN